MNDTALAKMENLVWQEAVQAPAWVIRQARPQDAGLIHEMYSRLSADSLYYRYLRPYKPQLEEARQLASLDDDRGFALLAVINAKQPQVIGVAHYILSLEDLSVAEPAVVVEDDWQGYGIGKALMAALAQEAAGHGVTYFRSAIHSLNARALHMATHGLNPSKVHWEDGLMIVERRLQENPFTKSAV
jgi:GNAT superfamily N-acetyltransferase